MPVSCSLAAKLFAPDTRALHVLTLNLLRLIYGIAIGFFEMLPNPTYRKINRFVGFRYALPNLQKITVPYSVPHKYENCYMRNK